MNTLEHYITSYFGVSNAGVKKLAHLFKEDQMAKGDFFTTQGTYCKQLSFVSEGVLRVFAATEHKEVTQWIATKGTFVTDLGSLIFNQTSRFSIQALTDCELYSISKTDYERLHNLIPDWPRLEKLFIAKCFVTLEDRVFTHLCLSAEERYRLLFSQNKELFQQVPLQYLASMLGMTPETLSRIRKASIS